MAGSAAPRSLGIVALAVLAACAAPAGAATYYTAVLDGPTAGTDSPAIGTAVFVLNDAQTEIAYHIEYTGMVGNETVAHIHNAPPGVVGPLFLDLPYGSPKTGVWPVGPFEVAELDAGRVNVLIHSDLYPISEIRGDLVYAGVADAPRDLPAGGGPRLLGNAPNPFNPATTIRFTLPRAGHVRLDVFDVRGRLVRRVLEETRPAGVQTARWDGTTGAGDAAPSGTYLCRLTAAGQVRTLKMLLVE